MDGSGSKEVVGNGRFPAEVSLTVIVAAALPSGPPTGPPTVPAVPPSPSPSPSTSTAVIRFGINDQPTDRIFSVNESPDRVFTYRAANNTVKLQRVSWHFKKDETSSYTEIDGVRIPLGLLPAGSHYFRNVEPDRVTLVFDSLRRQTNPSSQGTAEQVEDAGDGQALGKEMVLRIDWLCGNVMGRSQSGIFTVTEGVHPFDPNLTSAVERWLRSGNGLAGVDTILDPAISTAEAPAASSSALGSVPSGNPDHGPSVSPEGSTKNAGGGGLATGAIVGIVLGGAIALILIAALVFMLLRRRRRRHRRQHADTAADALKHDKEMHTAPAVDSPRLPYSEHDHTPHDGSVAPEDGAILAPHRVERGGHLPTPTAHNAAHGVSRTVAHLVEEGMTPEEIRRLEEEERHLDDEIERSARR
ncbi:hypothetical protein DCS_01118 [Drechmeria coniospora]|uniref:Uncharacterized protein n=1 Tax=Drechmeria coniospora TaxID=98403 RepID=A0A151GS91_DRECN|nr:hypothetical protein DCS_01118 [Drechmeria coniospora]KYK59984.1 hypothetical protein DCS_01118 [Drechmeria coniospora]ODA78779.1 hypothetical protein RJ55_06163 [Drechmeria coniospora]